MIVQIKFEPGSSKPNFLSLEDNATIHDLKIKMESIIDIPADCQEIHALSSSLENGLLLSSMVQPYDTISKTPAMNDSGIGINSAAVSLYSNNKFICIGNIQRNFFAQVEVDNRKPRKLPPIDQVHQYIETLDNDSCPSTCSSSSSVFDSSDIVECPKKSPEKCSTTNESSPLSSSFPSPLPPPYVYVDPEHRHLMLVITTDLPDKDFSGLLNYFYTLFETSQNCNRFQFNEKHSVAIFDDKLWLTCANMDTYEWVTRSLSSLSCYKSSSFSEHFDSIDCSIILPKVVKNKPLANIFQLLELQNSDLHTGKWCVVQRRTLLTTSEDYKEKAITNICDNEEILLWIDQDSMEFLKTKEFKLKYCFWTIHVKL